MPSPLLLPPLSHFCFPTSFVILPYVSIYRKHGTLCDANMTSVAVVLCSLLGFFSLTFLDVVSTLVQGLAQRLLMWAPVLN